MISGPSLESGVDVVEGVFVAAAIVVGGTASVEGASVAGMSVCGAPPQESKTDAAVIEIKIVKGKRREAFIPFKKGREREKKQALAIASQMEKYPGCGCRADLG